MKKVIRLLKSYDDLDLAEGQETEADVEVEFRIGEEKFSLDMTLVHAGEFRRDVARYIKAAGAAREPRRRQGRRRKPGEPGVPICRDPVPEGLTHQEGIDWLRGLREWAASEGRSDECPPKGKGGSYAYGQKLVDDYKSHLASSPPWSRAS